MKTPKSQPSSKNITALLADVDGTLVTKAKVLTPRAIEAVRRLRECGIVFCISSGRPPRGLRMFVEPLDLTEWRKAVVAYVERLIPALMLDDVVLGGGNVKNLGKLPKGCRAGDNANAFLGGFRLWEKKGNQS